MKFPLGFCVRTDWLTPDKAQRLFDKLREEGIEEFYDPVEDISLWKFVGVNCNGTCLMYDHSYSFDRVNDGSGRNILSQAWLDDYLGEFE